MLLLAALTASACTGDGPAATGEPSAERSAARAVADAAGPSLRRAKLQAGAAWERGALRAFCEDGRCTTDPGASPEGYVRLPEDGLMLFVVARAPDEGRVVVQRSGKRVMARRVAGSTTMPVEAALKPGRYRVKLEAAWGERTATWLFGIRVPG